MVEMELQCIRFCVGIIIIVVVAAVFVIYCCCCVVVIITAIGHGTILFDDPLVAAAAAVAAMTSSSCFAALRRITLSTLKYHLTNIHRTNIRQITPGIASANNVLMFPSWLKELPLPTALPMDDVMSHTMDDNNAARRYGYAPQSNVSKRFNDRQASSSNSRVK